MNDTSETPAAETPAPKEPALKKKSDAAMSGMVATYALLFAFAFTAIIVWISAG